MPFSRRCTPDTSGPPLDRRRLALARLRPRLLPILPATLLLAIFLSSSVLAAPTSAETAPPGAALTETAIAYPGNPIGAPSGDPARATAFDGSVRPSTLLQVQTTLQRDQARSFDPLRLELLTLIDDHRGEVSLAIVDLQTGERFHIDGETLHVAGSVIKLYIGLSAWRLVQEGLLSPVTVDRLLFEVFISQSNFAAELLAQMVGFDAINEEMRRYGAHSSVLTHHPGYVTEQAPGYIANSNLMTALDSVDTLVTLWQGDAIGPDASRAFLDRMDSTLVDLGLTAGLPPDARIKRKIGWIIPSDADPLWLNADAVNDVAIVQFDRNGETRAYAIGVFMQRNLNQHDAWVLTEEISRIVWEFFAEQRYARAAPAALDAASAG